MRPRARHGAAQFVKRQRDDWYPTPAPVTRALMHSYPFLTDGERGMVWEPACGDGAMAEVIAEAGYPVVATDLFLRGYGIGGIDFLKLRGPLARTVITNPPFKLANMFVLHALRLGVAHIAMLLPLSYLGGTTRKSDVFDVLPPTLVMVSSRRFDMWPGDCEIPDDANGSTMIMAWFIWSRGEAPRPPEWFDWKDFA